MSHTMAPPTTSIVNNKIAGFIVVIFTYLPTKST